jgi:ligand-binding SRPBCC domain-containing protein
MPVIFASTFIAAPRQRVFDLARSIEAHERTAAATKERAVAGVTTGLIGLGETVTWSARHFGLRQRLTVIITHFDPPDHFRDVMVSGAFKRMKHDHTFKDHPIGTLMLERFEFEAPLGLIGRLAVRLILMRKVRDFLGERNKNLKRIAESEEWRRYLKPE